MDHFLLIIVCFFFLEIKVMMHLMIAKIVLQQRIILYAPIEIDNLPFLFSTRFV